MRVKNLLCLFVLLIPLPSVAQPQVYHFKELQRFLPKDDFGPYRREKPTGETSSMMGFSTSWAQVVYQFDTDTSKSSISVKITDMLSIPSYMSLTGDIDKETETGYEKTVLYRNIRILETYDSASKSGKLQLPVASRFLVEITGSRVESTRSLYDLLDMTDLEGLEKLGKPANSP